MPSTIGEILAHSGTLKSISETPELDLQIILCHVLDKARAYLYTHTNVQLSGPQQRLFTSLLERRMRGEPIAYLIGHQGFWHIDLVVDPNVLIPRPETELLIEMALEIDRASVGSLVDLGTGSGAIAIALARERPLWQVSATDISAAALAVAEQNALLNGVSVHFLEGHWCTALIDRRFDIIISNPPYIDPSDPHLLAQSLCYEPASALVAKDKGLGALRTIITTSKSHLNENGWIVLEHGYDQSREVCAMLLDNGYQSIQTRKDISGNDRAVIAQARSR